MTRLMIGGDPLFLVREHHALALGAHHNLVFGHFEVCDSDFILILTSRPQRRLIDEIFQLRT